MEDIIVIVVNEDHNDIVVVGIGGKEDFVDVIVVVGIVGVFEKMQLKIIDS
jgi:hypothetical protein